MRQRIGDILVEHIGLAPDDLEMALDLQSRTKERIGKILLDKGLVQPVDMIRALALQAGVAFVDLEGYPIDWGLAQSIPAPWPGATAPSSSRCGGDRLVVAMVNPADVFALDDIRTITGGTSDPAWPTPPGRRRPRRGSARVRPRCGPPVDQARATTSAHQRPPNRARWPRPRTRRSSASSTC